MLFIVAVFTRRRFVIHPPFSTVHRMLLEALAAHV
jgi:hypothetical protein